MGEELKPYTLYIRNDDGSFFEIMKVTEMAHPIIYPEFIDSDNGSPGSAEWFTPELVATITLSDKQHREFIRAFLKEAARSRRIVRRSKRLKEKIRRNRLKETCNKPVIKWKVNQIDVPKLR